MTTASVLAFLKKFGIYMILGIIIIWLFFSKGCNNGPEVGTTRDTVTVTSYVPQPPVYVPQYVPQPYEVRVPVIIPPNYQPSSNYEELVKQYQNLASAFLTTTVYKDSVVLRDSTGRRVGVFNMNDVVTENKIKSRAPNYQLTFPHTTQTITVTNTIKEEPRNQLYVGLEGNSQLVNQPFAGASLGLVLKTKSDKMYSLRGGVQNNNGLMVPQVGVGIYWKIKLGK